MHTEEALRSHNVKTQPLRQNDDDNWSTDGTEGGRNVSSRIPEKPSVCELEDGQPFTMLTEEAVRHHTFGTLQQSYLNELYILAQKLKKKETKFQKKLNTGDTEQLERILKNIQIICTKQSKLRKLFVASCKQQTSALFGSSCEDSFKYKQQMAFRDSLKQRMDRYDFIQTEHPTSSVAK